MSIHFPSLQVNAFYPLRFFESLSSRNQLITFVAIAAIACLSLYYLTRSFFSESDSLKGHTVVEKEEESTSSPESTQKLEKDSDIETKSSETSSTSSVEEEFQLKFEELLPLFFSCFETSLTEEEIIENLRGYISKEKTVSPTQQLENLSINLTNLHDALPNSGHEKGKMKIIFDDSLQSALIPLFLKENNEIEDVLARFVFEGVSGERIIKQFEALKFVPESVSNSLIENLNKRVQKITGEEDHRNLMEAYMEEFEEDSINQLFSSFGQVDNDLMKRTIAFHTTLTMSAHLILLETKKEKVSFSTLEAKERREFLRNLLSAIAEKFGQELGPEFD